MPFFSHRQKDDIEPMYYLYYTVAALIDLREREREGGIKIKKEAFHEKSRLS